MKLKVKFRTQNDFDSVRNRERERGGGGSRERQKERGMRRERRGQPRLFTPYILMDFAMPKRVNRERRERWEREL